MLRRSAIALLLAISVGFRSAPAQAAPVTVFIVRHAEKGPKSPIPRSPKRASIAPRSWPGS